ncbi:unnamed protein product, partial [Iphiclides podalirius]
MRILMFTANAAGTVRASCCQAARRLIAKLPTRLGRMKAHRRLPEPSRRDSCNYPIECASTGSGQPHAPHV